jgi:hypothetical protein
MQLKMAEKGDYSSQFITFVVNCGFSALDSTAFKRGINILSDLENGFVSKSAKKLTEYRAICLLTTTCWRCDQPRGSRKWVRFAKMLGFQGGAGSRPAQYLARSVEFHSISFVCNNSSAPMRAPD